MNTEFCRDSQVRLRSRSYRLRSAVMMLPRFLLVLMIFGQLGAASANDRGRPRAVELKIGSTICSLSVWRLIAANFAAARQETDTAISTALNLEWGKLEKRCKRLEPNDSHAAFLTGRSVDLNEFGEVFETEDGGYVWSDDLEDN